MSYIINHQTYLESQKELFRFLGTSAPEGDINMKHLSKLTFVELNSSGYTEAAARRVIALCEASRRIEYLTEHESIKINSPEDVYRLIYPQIRDLKKEVFMLLCLDTKNKILKQETVSIGSLNIRIIAQKGGIDKINSISTG